jgi:hypothetical protein
MERHIAALSAAFVMSEPVAGALAKRPAHDTIEAILEWLIGGARQISPFAQSNRRSAQVVGLLKTVDRCRNAFHSRLQLEGQKLRVVA